MKSYGLLGYPLGHSFSKKFFEHKFKQEKLRNVFFQLLEVEYINEFSKILEQNPSLEGFAVTIPHKQNIIALLDSVSEEASRIGAVNCVRIKQGKLIGYNTDIIGFEKTFIPLLKQEQNNALILGTGGASKAVQFVLKKLHIPFTLVSRHAKNTETVNYEALNEPMMQSHNIIINTTPLGMSPNEQTFPPIPYQHLSKNHLLYDLVYKPEQTVFLANGSAKNAVTKNGFAMLLAQAEENWKIWNE